MTETNGQVFGDDHPAVVTLKAEAIRLKALAKQYDNELKFAEDRLSEANSAARFRLSKVDRLRNKVSETEEKEIQIRNALGYLGH